MDRPLRLAHTLSRIGVWFGGALIVLAAFVIGIEVVIRKAFSISIGGADELAGFALAIGSAWAFSFTFLQRAHIRIDFLYVWLPPRVCACLDVLALLAFTGFMALITWHGFGVFMESVDLGARSISPLATPLVIPQFLWFAGLVMFFPLVAVLFVRVGVMLVKGDVRGTQRLIGSKSAREEVKEEMQQVAKHKEVT